MDGCFNVVAVNKDKMRLHDLASEGLSIYVAVQQLRHVDKEIIDCTIGVGQTGGSRLNCRPAGFVFA